MISRFPPRDKRGLKIDEGVESEIPNVNLFMILNNISLHFH